MPDELPPKNPLPRINTAEDALDRIFNKQDQGKLSGEEAWGLANKIYDGDLVRRHFHVGDYSHQWKLTTRMSEKDIEQEEENLDFLFNEYLNDEWENESY